MNKKFEHDCENCEFLGQDENFDYYSCNSSYGITLVARYGHDGPNYWSMDLNTLKINIEEIIHNNPYSPAVYFKKSGFV